MNKAIASERRLWWIHSSTTNIDILHNYCISPACSFAEHRFLAFLLFLLDKQVNPQQYIFNITLFSNDLSINQPAIALKKTSTQYFGNKLFLVLKGELAGTIAKPKKIPNARAYRAVMDSGDIIGTINRDIKQTEIYSSYLISLLTKCKHLVTQKGGYIQALLFMLDQLGIDADSQEIIITKLC